MTCFHLSVGYRDGNSNRCGTNTKIITNSRRYAIPGWSQPLAGHRVPVVLRFDLSTHFWSICACFIIVGSHLLLKIRVGSYSWVLHGVQQVFAHWLALFFRFYKLIMKENEKVQICEQLVMRICQSHTICAF